MKSLNILGKEYEIKGQPKRYMGGDIGTGSSTNQVITFDETLKKDQRAETILHEMIHIVDQELGLGMTEEQVSRLAVGLYASDLMGIYR